MKWNDIPFVLAIAEYRTLQEAAEALDVNHTTVWRRIQALEKDMGTQLFIGSRKGYEPTQIGLEVIHHAKSISDNMDAIVRAISGQNMELKGLIRITAPAQAINTLLPSMLKAFQSLYPQIQFDVILDNAELDLEKREADIAIRVTHQMPDNLIGRCLGKIGWALYVHRDLHTGGPLSIDDIKQLPMIGYHHFKAPAGLWYEQQFGHIAKTLMCSDIDMARGFAEAGMGVALLPIGVENTLNEIYRLPDGLEMELWLLTHKDMRSSAKIKALWSFLLEHLPQHSVIQNSVR